MIVLLCRAPAQRLANSDQSQQHGVAVGGVLREVAASEVFNVCFSVVTASLSWYYSLGKTNMGLFVGLL